MAQRRQPQDTATKACTAPLTVRRAGGRAVNSIMSAWTTDKPTKRGFYWYRELRGDPGKPVEVTFAPGIAWCSGIDFGGRLEHIDGEWQPIEEPKT